MTGPRDQAGSVAVVQATWLVAVVVLVGLAILDVGTFLRGARDAGAAADGAALAAASASRTSSATTPRAAAARIATAHGAELVTCECDTLPVGVEVALPVTTRFLHHLGLARARARATATLVPRTGDDDRAVTAR